MTWAVSPAYGRAVALGPTQRAVLDVALGLTRGGRRPELTLARLASLSGRPVSSVHEALGRLRALGLLGVSARMGRHGGHRLWRVQRAAMRALNPDAHRRAIARMVRRFGAAVSQAVSDGHGGASGRPTRSPGTRSPGDRVNQAETDAAGTRVSRPMGSPADTAPAGEPDRPWWDTRPSLAPRPDEPFRDKMRRYGIGPWIDEEKETSR